MSKCKILPGVNIQYPISTLIIEGQKSVETRTYKLPDKYLNTDIYLIETPGSQGGFEARVTGITRFTKCFEYKSKSEFYRDIKRHNVDPKSPWAWKDKSKWGWEVKLIKKLPPKTLKNKKGIVFTERVLL